MKTKRESLRLHWERHGDLIVLKDWFGTKRAILFRQPQSMYYVVAPIGTPVDCEERYGTNKRKLMSMAVRMVREALK